MAKAYRVKYDTTFPRVIAEIKREGQDPLLETEGINYPAGSYVLESNMTHRDRERASSGALDHLLEPAEEGDVEQHARSTAEPEFGVFVPEHEAEAHALEQYGHHVVPGEQVLEVMSSGAESAREYQEAVKNAGFDRRAPQEAMAQPRERIPDHLLLGRETRTGAPHNPGAEGQYEQQEQSEEQGDGAQESEQESGDQATLTPRPRPGSESEGQPEGTSEGSEAQGG